MAIVLVYVLSGCSRNLMPKSSYDTTETNSLHIQKNKPSGWCSFSGLELGSIASKESFAFYKGNVNRLAFLLRNNAKKMLDDLKEMTAEIDCSKATINSATLSLIYDYSLGSNMIQDDVSGAAQRVKMNLGYELKQHSDIDTRQSDIIDKHNIITGAFTTYSSFQVSSASYSYLHNQESALELLSFNLMQKLRSKLLYLYSQHNYSDLENNHGKK